MSTVVQEPGGDVTEPGRGGRGWLMVGVGVGAAALIGGGAFAAVKFMGGGGEQPDTVLPASSAVYVRLDVDPGVGQKVAAVRFLQGLDPEIKDRLDQGEWRELLWEQLEEDGDVPADLDYEKDVEPWLGDRAGLAVVPRGGDQEPLAAIALQVKDGDKALATLDKIKAENADAAEDEQFDYYLDDDYVVLTQASMLEDLRSAAEQGTLADHEPYAEDMKALGDAGIASMWVDAARAAELDESLVNPPMGADDIMGAMGADSELVQGRMAATLRLNADSVEVHGVSRGVDGLELPAAADTPHLIEDLPADTAVALSVENGAAMVQAAWDFYAKTYPDEVADLTTQAADAGFTLPDDVKTVLGDSMALSVGPGIVEAFQGMSETSTDLPPLPVGYRVHTDAERVTTMLSDAGLPPTMIAQRTDEGVLTLGVHQPYVDELAAPEGRLGDDATYRAAVADAGKAQSVFYVDVNAFEQYYLPEVTDEDARSALEQLAAVGISSTMDDDGLGRFTLRFVADQG